MRPNSIIITNTNSWTVYYYTSAALATSTVIHFTVPQGQCCLLQVTIACHRDSIWSFRFITMFRVIQLFVFVFGRIVHRTIRIRPNSLKPLFGTSLISECLVFVVLYTVSHKKVATLFLRQLVRCELVSVILSPLNSEINDGNSWNKN